MARPKGGEIHGFQVYLISAVADTATSIRIRTDDKIFYKLWLSDFSVDSRMCVVAREGRRWRETRLSGNPGFPAVLAIAPSVRMNDKTITCFRDDLV